MSSQLTVLQGNVPAHLAQAAQVAAERNAGALVGTGGGGVDRISLKQSRFRLIEGGEEVAVLQQSALNLVLLRINDGITKTYYDTQWNPNQEAEAPTCYSDDGVVPSPNAEKPQARTCAECPHNAWGSRINPHTQAEGKACADSKRISVVAEGQVGNKDSKTYQLSVPAASLKDLGKYIRQLNALSPAVPYNAVVTQVAFDTNATFPKLNFAPVRYLTGEEFQVAESRYNSEPVKLTAGLAEAAAAHARQRAASQANIPGQNPAAQAQAAVNNVRQQGQAQSQQQAAQQPQQQAASDFGAADQGQEQAQAQQTQQEASQPQQQAASDFGAADPQPNPAADVGQETQAASDFGTQPAQEPEPQVQQTQQAASDFGSQPAQEAQQAQQTQAASDFGAEQVIDELSEPQAQQTQGASDFGTQSPVEGTVVEQSNKASKLDDVFGGDWDD